MYARVVKLVYTYALGAYAARRAGSSPVAGTTTPFGVYFLAKYDIIVVQGLLCNIIKGGVHYENVRKKRNRGSGSRRQDHASYLSNRHRKW